MFAVRYSPVLSALPEAERRRLLRLSSLRSYQPRDRVVLAGERTDKVFLVSDGLVKIVDPDGAGRETIVALALIGDLLADAEAIEGRPPFFDGVACTACSILALDRQEFVTAVATHPAAALALARTSAERAHAIARNAMDRTQGNTTTRIASRLIDLAEILGRMRGGVIELELPMSREELGHLAGMCRESATRALSSLRSQGALEFNGREVKILRPELLELIRCEERVAEPSPSADGEESRRSLSSSGI